MASVWWLPYWLMWAMASSNPSTTLMLMMGAEVFLEPILLSGVRQLGTIDTPRQQWHGSSAQQRISTPLSA
jgi:ABC-type xylose transport system substrate-binding protein